jgi:hypothetical protein
MGYVHQQLLRHHAPPVIRNRQHVVPALLRARDHDVTSPLVHWQVNRADAADGVHKQQLAELLGLTKVAEVGEMARLDIPILLGLLRRWRSALEPGPDLQVAPASSSALARIFSIVFLFVGDIDVIANLTSFSALVAFSVVNISLIWMRYRQITFAERRESVPVLHAYA